MGGWTTDGAGDLMLQPLAGYQPAGQPGVGVALRLDGIGEDEPRQYVLSAEGAAELGADLIAMAKRASV